MIKGKKGHVISTASMASFIQAAGMVDYCVTKAGVMSFHEGESIGPLDSPDGSLP